MTSVKRLSRKKEKRPGRLARYMERNRVSEGYLIKRDFGRVAGGLFRVVLLFGLCFLILQPLLHQLSNSFMSANDLLDPTVITVPRYPTLAVYVLAMELMNYWGSLFRTLGITFAVALLQVAACSLAAYGFARFNFPLKRFWFICVILTILIPPRTIMAPMFLNFRFFNFFGLFSLLGLEPVNMLSLNGYLIMAATGMGLRSGLYIFMLRQYMRNMPRELEEAAYVDGCSKIRTFVQIILPDAMPMLVSCFLFAFVWQWTDGFFSSMFLRGHGVMAIQMSALGETFRDYFISLIIAAQGGHGFAPPMGELQQMISTGLLLGIAPVIIIYIFAQRMFVESIGQSGLKM
ncbi:MAG: carbohydrate ABC transporter permease [Defluviitaleaceae bacterium]|nr:carbohydrate ABC transporter permease [Defluviitaleaceae bacterium]